MCFEKNGYVTTKLEVTVTAEMCVSCLYRAARGRVAASGIAKSRRAILTPAINFRKIRNGVLFQRRLLCFA